MEDRTRIQLGRREDLGADCANCFGLCCVALAFAKSADFPFDGSEEPPTTALEGVWGCYDRSNQAAARCAVTWLRSDGTDSWVCTADLGAGRS